MRYYPFYINIKRADTLSISIDVDAKKMIVRADGIQSLIELLESDDTSVLINVIQVPYYLFLVFFTHLFRPLRIALKIIVRDSNSCTVSQRYSY